MLSGVGEVVSQQQDLNSVFLYKNYLLLMLKNFFAKLRAKDIYR